MRNTLSNLIALLCLICTSTLFIEKAVAAGCGSYTTCMTEADGTQTCITVDRPCPIKSEPPVTSTDTVHGSTDTVHGTPPPDKPKKKGSEATQ